MERRSVIGPRPGDAVSASVSYSCRGACAHIKLSAQLCSWCEWTGNYGSWRVYMGSRIQYELWRRLRCTLEQTKVNCKTNPNFLIIRMSMIGCFVVNSLEIDKKLFHWNLIYIRLRSYIDWILNAYVAPTGTDLWRPWGQQPRQHKIPWCHSVCDARWNKTRTVPCVYLLLLGVYVIYSFTKCPHK